MEVIYVFNSKKEVEFTLSSIGEAVKHECDPASARRAIKGFWEQGKHGTYKGLFWVKLTPEDKEKKTGEINSIIENHTLINTDGYCIHCKKVEVFPGDNQLSNDHWFFSKNPKGRFTRKLDSGEESKGIFVCKIKKRGYELSRRQEEKKKEN